MRRGRKTAYGRRFLPRRAVLLLLAFVLCLIPACAGENAPEIPRPPRPHEAAQDDYDQQAIVRYPLTTVTKRSFENDCVMLYPYVVTPGMNTLNISIYTAFTDFRAECEAQGGRIGWTTEFNRYGLLSLLMTYTSEAGDLLFTETANFNTDTGLRVRLSDCFGAGGAGYRERLGEIVRGYAETNGLTVISKEPSFDDSTQFLFTFGGLNLLFREYELFTADAGSPRIRVKCSEVTDVTGSDGLLNRVK